jgi:hypothetical protein
LESKEKPWVMQGNKKRGGPSDRVTEASYFGCKNGKILWSDAASGDDEWYIKRRGDKPPYTFEIKDCENKCRGGKFAETGKSRQQYKYLGRVAKLSFVPQGRTERILKSASIEGSVINSDVEAMNRGGGEGKPKFMQTEASEKKMEAMIKSGKHTKGNLEQLAIVAMEVSMLILLLMDYTIC